MSSRSKFKTLIVIDLETSGSIKDEPKITELAMIAVNIEALGNTKPEEEVPRVLNKFVKFFDPVKLLNVNVANMTGLTNLMLMDYAPFNRETVIGIEAFLSDFQQPMCFVAHNGDQFDFPILFHEIRTALNESKFLIDNNTQLHYQSTGLTFDNDDPPPLTTHISTQTINSRDDHNQLLLLSIACADSLAFFRHLRQTLTDKDTLQQSNSSECLNECHNQPTVNAVEGTLSSGISVENTPSPAHLPLVEEPIPYIPSPDPERNQPSLKLSQIYQREFTRGTFHLKAHQAESDCLMLLAILKRYLDRWLDWIEANHHPLSYFSSSSLATTKTTLSN